MEQVEEPDLARRRQRGFRLVEDEDALPLAALLEEAHETFAVGVREEVGPKVPHILRGFIQITRHREKTLGAEEPTLGDPGQPAGAQRVRQVSTLNLDRPGVIDRPITLASTGAVITRERGDPL